LLIIPISGIYVCCCFCRCWGCRCALPSTRGPSPPSLASSACNRHPAASDQYNAVCCSLFLFFQFMLPKTSHEIHRRIWTWFCGTGLCYWRVFFQKRILTSGAGTRGIRKLPHKSSLTHSQLHPRLIPRVMSISSLQLALDCLLDAEPWDPVAVERARAKLVSAREADRHARD
jgi:hypothetical protein